MSNPKPVDQLVDAERVTKDVMVDMTQLNEEFVRQPGLVYYYTSQAAKAERQHSELKLRLEATEAKVASNIREAALKKLDKPPTVAAVTEQVRLHAAVIAVEQQLIQAKEVESMLKGVVEAMRHKRDSLQMLGFMERDERKANIEVRETMNINVAGPGNVTDTATAVAAYRARIASGKEQLAPAQ